MKFVKSISSCDCWVLSHDRLTGVGRGWGTFGGWGDFLADLADQSEWFINHNTALWQLFMAFYLDRPDPPQERNWAADHQIEPNENYLVAVTPLATSDNAESYKSISSELYLHHPPGSPRIVIVIYDGYALHGVDSILVE